MKRLFLVLLLVLLAAQPVLAARAKIATLAADPYLSALVMDADTGEILVDENSGAVAYPASVLKLMVLYVVLDRIAQGSLRLDEMVQVTREASRMGGSQVYLDPQEQFSVDDLLYALIIQSANDAAVALAVHAAGSKDAFVVLMNEKAKELGMNNTSFYSVHGLPPSEGQQPDSTTARDMAILARELAKNPEVFKYTSTREREFRGGEFIMRTHNKLLASVDGCDGFKTGYFKAAGFSIVATAKRNGVRIIAVVLGSLDRKVRDAKTSELLAIGFAKAKPRPEPQAVLQKAAASPAPQTAPAPPAEQQSMAAEKKQESATSLGRDLMMIGLGFGAGLLACIIVAMVRSRPRSRRRRLM
ncbi:MAG: D-alanyl-D-alanine carboxypeptidase [Desulfofustis sp.]|jgi:D-alanyl-D-alanine carboxypeptidase (penicillin-binding protein 5/6)